MLELRYQPFDDDYYMTNFTRTEAVEWADGVLTDSVYADLLRIGVSPSVLGWEKTGARPRVLARSLLELRIAETLGLRELIVSGYRHFDRTTLIMTGPFATDNVPNCLALGDLRDAQGLLVSSLSDHEDPDVGYLDHEESKPTWWYDGLSAVLARSERATAAPPRGALPIGFVAHADETTPKGWPRMSPALRRELVRLGALLPASIPGKSGPASMPRATLQLLASAAGFVVGAVGALRDGDTVRFGPVSETLDAPLGLLPIGTVGDGRFVLVDLDDLHLENPALFALDATGTREIGRVSELFAVAKGMVMRGPDDV